MAQKLRRLRFIVGCMVRHNRQYQNPQPDVWYCPVCDEAWTFRGK